MTPQTTRFMRRAGRLFVASFFLTPVLLWGFAVGILGRDFAFPGDFFDFYRGLFSSSPESIGPWLILLAPVVLCEFVLACWHYWRHPGEIRSILRFPKRRQ